MPDAGPPGGTAPEGYRLLRTLGYGGDGWVMLAVQESLGREVAVKTLYATDPTAVARFRREGQALSRLASDRIVRVYDLLEDGGRFCLVLEYVPGGSLADRLLQQAPLSAGERIAVLSDVAEALARAHGAGVVHRDVKPTNVLLDAAGRAKLTDFGIARLTGGTAAFRTQDGTISATRRYAPPEQLSDPLADAPSIDAYAFGVLAHDLLVGPGGDTSGLPGAAVQALTDAVDADPRRRPDPESLVRALASVPPGSWRPPVTRRASTEDTARGTARASGAAVAPANTNPSQRSSSAGLGWVEPAVYQPPRRRRSPRAAWIVGGVVGVMAALVLTLLLS